MAEIIENSRETQEKVMSLIDTANGRWFSGMFVKQGKKGYGDDREMTARTGVAKHVTGVGLAFDPRATGQVACWVANEGKDGADAYRMFNTRTARWIKVDGITYDIHPDGITKREVA